MSFPGLEVVTVGETMIRLSPEIGTRLEKSESLKLAVAGTESNVAVALARLGVKTGWVSKLVRNALGRRIVGELQWHGVDTSAVVWTETGRIGTFFLEPGAKPRPSEIIYDRAGSSASTMSTAEVDMEYIRSAQHVHLTGITAAISQSCRSMVGELAESCHESGKTISFDINYRQKLWSPSEARDTIEPVLPHVDLLITTLEDAARILRIEGKPDVVCRELHNRYGCPWIVVTLGAEGAIALANGEIHRVTGYELEPVDRVGAGDAFAAGCIYGFLQQNPETALRFGVALAALKHSIAGDLSFISKQEVERLLEKGSQDIQR